MRLLNTHTGNFEWFDDLRTVRYAILSHVWAKETDPECPLEQTYQDVVAIQSSTESASILPKLSKKVQNACRIAREHQYRYIWIDSCCIDKTSSAELSEAINSMFNWYRWAKVCYAFLEDVDDEDNPHSPHSRFCDSQWFLRGWTLQELIAPDTVLFLSTTWTPIDTKHRLADVIYKFTRIDPAILRHTRNLEDVCVAERMSWAIERKTAKKEDEAYCLLGLFGINMTPIYGEGSYAFTRLQKAILKQIPDQSIFAWGARYKPIFEPPSDREGRRARATTLQVSGSQDSYLLASSPSDFASSFDITAVAPAELAKALGLSHVVYPEYTTTSYGIRTQFPLITLNQDGSEYKLALLACRDGTGNLIALVLHSSDSGRSGAEMLVGAHQRDSMAIDLTRPHKAMSNFLSGFTRLASISKEDIKACREAGNINIRDVYVHHRIPTIQQSLSQDEPIHTALCASPPALGAPIVTVDPWCPHLLERQGYGFTGVTTGKRPAGSFTLSCGQETISIKISQCSCEMGRSQGWLRALVVFSGDEDVGWMPGTASQAMYSGALACAQDHIYNWDCYDGVATRTFKSPSSNSDQLVRCLRLRLSLQNPKALQKSYILSIDIFTTLPDSRRPLHNDVRQEGRRSRAPSPLRQPPPISAKVTTRTRSRSADGLFERVSIAGSGSFLLQSPPMNSPEQLPEDPLEGSVSIMNGLPEIIALPESNVRPAWQALATPSHTLDGRSVDIDFVDARQTRMIDPQLPPQRAHPTAAAPPRRTGDEAFRKAKIGAEILARQAVTVDVDEKSSSKLSRWRTFRNAFRVSKSLRR